MRLRNRLSEQLILRLEAHLPLQTGPGWNSSKAVCILEQLSINEATGIRDDWQQTAEFQGRMRAELFANGVSGLSLELLLANLLVEPLQLLPDVSTPVDDLSETARAMLDEYRETLDQGQLMPVLYFRVSGSMVRRLAAPQDINEVYLGVAPDIGLAHQADYQQVV